MSNFELSSLALKSAYSENTIITDDKGLPSVMVYIPKFKMSDVIDGGSDSTHPAFIVDGVEKDGIYISKYQNVVYEGRAYSLPGEDAARNVSFDTASTYCSAKGAGWHLMTAMEWGAIALWCKKNGWLPYGNNDSGKDIRETDYTAIPVEVDSDGKTVFVATGTGPVEWSHNKQIDGIYDLNGNFAEMLGGLRLVYGELQILENNNAADHANMQSETSAHWKAIDGTTGELITPNGFGTTKNSLKLDFINNHWEYITGEVSNRNDHTASCAFNEVSLSNSVCDKAREILVALAMFPDDPGFDYKFVRIYANNGSAERLLRRGGSFDSNYSSGVFFASLDSTRTTVSSKNGFRSAYYE